MTLETIPCRQENYGGPRTGPASYLVVHYTAGDGDTARANGLYFARNTVAASAHYFVDDGGAVASVPETHVAWHCGAASYRHPSCRNGNSLGVELCDTQADGSYGFTEATLENALTLLADLMARHSVPIDHVVRHYDVTGKCCPAPFVTDEGAWRRFLERLEERTMTDETFAALCQRRQAAVGAQPPGDWSAEARAWAEGRGLLVGDSAGMRYKSPVTREELVQILYRLTKEERHGDTE